MAKFIELKDATDEKRMYLNFDHVISVKPGSSDKGCVIRINGDATLKVLNTYDEIAYKIELDQNEEK